MSKLVTLIALFISFSALATQMGDNQSSNVTLNDNPPLDGKEISAAPTSEVGVPPFIFRKEEAPRPQLPETRETQISVPGYQPGKFDDFATSNTTDPDQRPQLGETHLRRPENNVISSAQTKTKNILVSYGALRSILMDGSLDASERNFVSKILYKVQNQNSKPSDQFVFLDEHGDTLVRIMLPSIPDSTLQGLLEKLSSIKARLHSEYHPGVSKEFKSFYQKLYCIGIYSK